MFSLLDNKAKASSLPAISWSSVENIAPRLTDGSSWQPKPSVLDLLAAPTVFLQQALVYERDLDEHALRDALQVVVNGQPLFAARLTDSKVRQQRPLLYSQLQACYSSVHYLPYDLTSCC